ncbi:MAG: hypothetical protein ACXQS8_02460, partial [Candidatus Helarchaeales archaeon]
KKFQVKILHSLLPDLLRFFWLMDERSRLNFLKELLEFYPTFELRFYLPADHTVLNFTCYDNYVSTQTGGFLPASIGHIMIVHDANISKAYRHLFNRIWMESVDLRMAILAFFKEDEVLQAFLHNHLEKYPNTGKYGIEDCETFYRTRKINCDEDFSIKMQKYFQID